MNIIPSTPRGSKTTKFYARVAKITDHEAGKMREHTVGKKRGIAEILRLFGDDQTPQKIGKITANKIIGEMGIRGLGNSRAARKILSDTCKLAAEELHYFRSPKLNISPRERLLGAYQATEGLFTLASKELAANGVHVDSEKLHIKFIEIAADAFSYSEKYIRGRT